MAAEEFATINALLRRIQQAACADEDTAPCPPGQHKWTGQRMGGSPDTAEAAEWVGYCSVCGAEKTDDD